MNAPVDPPPDVISYREILEAVDEGVVVQDRDRRILAINRAASEYYGVAAADALGKTPEELDWELLDEDLPVEERPSALAAAGTPVMSRTLHMRLPTAGERWLEITSVPLPVGEDPDAALLVTTVRDVTARHGVTQRLRYQASLLDAVGQAAVGTDTTGAVLYWNRAAEEMFGWSAAEVTGRQVGGLTSAADDPGARLVLERLAAGLSFSGDVRCLRKDGSSFDALVTAAPVHDDDGGRAVGWIAVASDITARKRAEAAFRRLSAIVESSRDAIVGKRLDGTITSWNRGAEELYGWTAEEAIGRHISFIVPPDRLDELAGLMARANEGRGTSAVETIRVRKDGETVDVSVTVSPVFDADGSVRAMAAIARDISQRRRLERVLAEDRERLEEAQRVAHLGSWEHDLATDATYWSDELHRILGVPLDAPSALRSYLDAVHPADRLEVVGQWERVRAGTGDMETAHRLIRPDGEVRWVEARAWLGASGVVRGTVLDITERSRAEAALTHQALHDPLTGLPNRLLLTDRLDQALARAEGRRTRVAALFLDLDRFKVVNDAIGHGAGDSLLVHVADRLRTALRPSDTLGRFGADEFVIICDDVVGGWDADVLARRVAGALEDPFYVADRELYISASIGVMVSPAEGISAEALLRDAEAAMYRAKTKGRGHLELFDDSLGVQAAARLELESGLRRALERDELWVAYQPIVDLDHGRPVGVEALVRWLRPDGTSIPPADFIPIAEDTGLIVPIGRWVLRQALGDLVRIRRTRPGLADLFMAVNVSGRQLLTAELLPVVVEELERAGLEPSALHLEITESVLMEDVEHSIEVLAALRSVGVRLAVDDFGTGYSSLSYLKRLPLDTLKVDRSFVAGLGIDPNDSSIVDAITGLGRALGMFVLAEGVEDELQRSHLSDLGCHLAQGFLWSRPAPPDEAARWLGEAIDA